jgi:hypothetical protein
LWAEISLLNTILKLIAAYFLFKNFELEQNRITNTCRVR